MTDSNFLEKSEEWSIEVFGVRFVEGTVSSALTSFLTITIFFIFCYGTFRLLRLRWGTHKSLCMTFFLIHIIPAVILLATKYLIQH